MRRLHFITSPTSLTLSNFLVIPGLICPIFSPYFGSLVKNKHAGKNGNVCCRCAHTIWICKWGKKKKGGNGICMIIASVAHVLQHSSELMLTLRGRLPCCRRFPSCHNKLYGLTAFIWLEKSCFPPPSGQRRAFSTSSWTRLSFPHLLLSVFTALDEMMKERFSQRSWWSIRYNVTVSKSSYKHQIQH